MAVSEGFEPILEKRSAMVRRRSMSLLMSGMRGSSGYFILRISIQAKSDVMGVPSWWAVSFERPTQSLFCSERLDVANAQNAAARNRATTENWM